MSVADIFAAANAIEQAYAAHGYVLVRVAVPPQKLENGGTLHLVVIDGFVEGVDVKGVPEKQRALVQARLASLIGERHVTLSEIERRLILASDIPGLVLSSTIARGTAPGGTLLVLEATQSAVAGTLGFDNRLPSSLGTWELNGALAVNSPLGYGEQIYGAASTGYNLGKVFERDDADAAARRRLRAADRRRRTEDQSRIHQLGDEARADARGRRPTSAIISASTCARAIR